ncbi:DNA methyltransferase, partial [Salmonella enterica]|uniref:DNA methyltransferase n=1 Tax=Salmonella enterica TaxID=28901 RepID=UPI000AF01770
QWQLPNERQYLALQALFNKKAEEAGGNGLIEPHKVLREEYGVLSAHYSALVMEYDELRKQYENLRRPFRVTKEVPYTNVSTYPPVPYYPGKHPCEKPIEMMIDIISASTRPGDVVDEFFMTSGTQVTAALQL